MQIHAFEDVLLFPIMNVYALDQFFQVPFMRFSVVSDSCQMKI